MNLIAEWMQRFSDHIFAYYDSLLPIDSDEIIKRHQIWLNNPQWGHKEGQTFPFVWWDNHQGNSSHIHVHTKVEEDFIVVFAILKEEKRKIICYPLILHPHKSSIKIIINEVCFCPSFLNTPPCQYPRLYDAPSTASSIYSLLLAASQ